VFAPLLGALSDRFGRRPVVLLSNAGLGLDYVFMAVTSSLSLLFIGRVVSGITAASFPTASAYVSDVTPPEKRAAAFGMIGAAFGAGFVVGPALGGWLGAIEPRLPFWVAAGLSLGNAFYGLWVLPESLPRERRSRFEWRRAHPLGALSVLRAQAGIRELVGVVFVSNVAHFVLQSTFVLYAGYRYGWSPKVIGATLTAMGACVVVVQGVLVRPIVARLGERRTLLLGLVSGVVGFAIYGAASTSVGFWMGIPFAILWGVSTPALQALVTRRTSAAHQGKLQGTLAAAAAMAGIVGPPLFAQIFAWVVARPERAAWVGAPFYAAAGLIFVALGIAVHASREAAS
jgi:DHA1 family tetracycline resistance protein-like MFS transporter